MTRVVTVGVAPAARAPGALRGLAVLLVLTGLVTAVVDVGTVVALTRSDAAGPSGGAAAALGVRTLWGVVRAVGFLLVPRHVLRGRVGARVVVVVLCVSILFSVARVTGHGQLTGRVRPLLYAGFGAVAVLCALVLAVLLGVPAVRAHLRSTGGRHLPAWVAASRPLALALLPCMLVPFLVGVIGVLSAGGGTGPDVPLLLAVPALVGWLAVIGVVAQVLAPATAGLARGFRIARWVVVAATLLVLATQPALCLLFGGVDGLVRDGLPVVVVGLLLLHALGGPRRAHFGVRRTG